MRRRFPDIAIFLLLLALPLLMFWQQTVGGKTLIPADNLYQYQPYAAYRDQVGAPAVPYNALVSDLVLENYQFKAFIRLSISHGDFPLWNPYQFSGIPFFAAGQQSTLYPFSIIYYILPLANAYGWFMVSQLCLAGIFMFLFARGLGLGRSGSVVAGVVYQLSAFFVISAVFPMIVAAAVWLPLILLMIEFVIERRPALRGQSTVIPWLAIGAGALGCCVLAGHVEITYYTLIIAAYYAAARLLYLWWKSRRYPLSNPPPTSGDGANKDGAFSPLLEIGEGQGVGSALRSLIPRGLIILALLALGVGLGSIQFIPTLEDAQTNFRSDTATFQQILSYAHPPRDLIQFLMPNFLDLLGYQQWNPVVMDWKLSASYSSDYSRQLLICGITVYFKRLEQRDKTPYTFEKIKLYEVNLFKGQVKEHVFTQDEVNEMIDYINLTGEDIFLLTGNRKYEEFEITEFDQTDNQSSCRMCNFRPLCSYLLTHKNCYDEKSYLEYVRDQQYS